MGDNDKKSLSLYWRNNECQLLRAARKVFCNFAVGTGRGEGEILLASMNRRKNVEIYITVLLCGNAELD